MPIVERESLLNNFILCFCDSKKAFRGRYAYSTFTGKNFFLFPKKCFHFKLFAELETEKKVCHHTLPTAAIPRKSFYPLQQHPTRRKKQNPNTHNCDAMQLAKCFSIQSRSLLVTNAKAFQYEKNSEISFCRPQNAMDLGETRLCLRFIHSFTMCFAITRETIESFAELMKTSLR